MLLQHQFRWLVVLKIIKMLKSIDIKRAVTSSNSETLSPQPWIGRVMSEAPKCYKIGKSDSTCFYVD